MDLSATTIHSAGGERLGPRRTPKECQQETQSPRTMLPTEKRRRRRRHHAAPEDQGFRPETTANTKHEGDGDTLDVASREGNDTRGCHRRRSDQGRTEFSSVALHISTPPSFRQAPKDASHRQHRSHLQSEPQNTTEEARLKPPPSTHLEPQQPQAMQGPDPSRWPSPAPRDCHTNGPDTHHQPHFGANFTEASPPAPHT